MAHGTAYHTGIVQGKYELTWRGGVHVHVLMLCTKSILLLIFV